MGGRAPSKGKESGEATPRLATANGVEATGPLLLDLVQSLAAPAGFASPSLIEHNTLVARIGGELAELLGLPATEREALVLAGLLHDIGALSNGLPLSDVHAHAQMGDDGHAAVGSKLLDGIAPLTQVAALVRHHHVAWDEGRGTANDGAEVPAIAHLLNLCDTAGVLVDPRRPAVAQPNQICRAIRGQRGTQLHPRYVEAFLELATRSDFWQHSVRRPADSLSSFASDTRVTLDSDTGLQLARTFAQLADLRAGSAATHGVGVGTVAAMLGQAAGWEPTRCDQLRVAGYVHDIGHMAVPVSILSKPGELPEEDWTLLRAHAHLGSRVLRQFEGYEQLSIWVAHHHERLNGGGYPERLSADDLPLGSRILQVADAYAAMSEDRPYRAGRTAYGALRELQALAKIGLFDVDVVGWLGQHQADIEAARAEAQAAAALRLANLQRPARVVR